MTIQTKIEFEWSCPTDEVDDYDAVVADQIDFLEQNEDIVAYNDLDLGRTCVVVNLDGDEAEEFERKLKDIVDEAGAYIV